MVIILHHWIRHPKTQMLIKTLPLEILKVFGHTFITHTVVDSKNQSDLPNSVQVEKYNKSHYQSHTTSQLIWDWLLVANNSTTQDSMVSSQIQYSKLVMVHMSTQNWSCLITTWNAIPIQNRIAVRDPNKHSFTKQ